MKNLLWPTVGIRANHGLESKHMNWNNFLGFYSRGFCPVSETSIKSELEFYCICGIYSSRREDRWVARHRRRPDAPSRALSTTTREGHAPDRKPNWLADVMLASA